MAFVLTEHWVDFAAGDDGIGDGSEGNPWKTIQHAYDQIVLSRGTDGDCINVVSDEVLATPLSLNGLSNQYQQPLLIRNDGAGYVAIDGDGSGLVDGSVLITEYTTFQGIKFTNSGSDNLIQPFTNQDELTFFDCWFDGGAAALSNMRTGITVMGCLFSNQTSVAYNVSGAAGSHHRLMHNTFYNVNGAITTYRKGGVYVVGNLIVMNSAATNDAINLNTREGQNATYFNNTVFGNGCSQMGFRAKNLIWDELMICNNIISGFVGGGSFGIFFGGSNDNFAKMIGFNGFYNNTTHHNIAANAELQIDLTGNDVYFTADPFVDSANGDFTPTAEAIAAGFPLTMPGLSGSIETDQNITLGAISPAAGGGGRRPRARFHGV